MKKVVLYLVGMIVSVVLVAFSMTVLGDTTIMAPVILALSLYLFLGCLIKLCKMNETLKNTVICAIDLLFWLP